MRQVKLITLTAFVMFILGGYVTTAANAAEDTGNPSILCLVKGCQSLELTAKGGTIITRGLKGKTLESASSEAKIKNCEAIAGTEEKDIVLCKDVPLALTGVHVSGTETKCKSEGDEPGSLLSLIDLHLASGLSPSGVLEPLGLGKVLNAKLESASVVATCGVLKIEVKGTFACSAPIGLRNIPTTEEVTITCKMKEGDPVVDTCVSLCEWLKTDPFLLNLGSGFEDAAKEFTISGRPNKDVFIDD